MLEDVFFNSLKEGSIVRDRLIVTVGTSLLGSLARNDELKGFLEAKDVSGLVRHLLSLDPSNRACGAEINSTLSLVSRGKVILDTVYLIHSDTPEGTLIGEVLKSYFINDRGPFGLKEHHVHLVKIDGLVDANPAKFLKEGLRNFINKMGKIIKDNPQRTAINATGGFKAEISLCAVIGQAFEIPVYYMFEKFGEIIELPAMPLTIDYEKWIKWIDILRELKDREVIFEDDKELFKKLTFLLNTFPEFSNLMEEIDVDGKKAFSLNFMGELFLEVFELKLPQIKEKYLPPPREGKFNFISSSSEPKSLAFAKKHSLESLLEKKDYIKSARITWYKPNVPKKTEVRVKNPSKGELELVYFTDNGGIMMILETTAEDETQLYFAREDLQEYLEKKL